MSKNNLSQPNDKEFLQETKHLSDSDFVQAVFRNYLKRSVDEEGLNELIKILSEFETKENFITQFIKPSAEFQNLWPSSEINNSQQDTERQNITNDSVTVNTPEPEDSVYKTNSKYDILVDKYLKTIENVPLNKTYIDKEFLQQTRPLSDIDFVKAVFRVYLQRPSINESSANELVEVLQNMKTRWSFLTQFVKLSTEYSLLWPSTSLFTNSKDDASEPKLKNDNTSKIKSDQFLLNNKSYDQDIFEEYLEIIKDTPVSQINDLEFLSATDHLNSKDFLRAVWIAYYKAPIDDLNISLYQGYVENKPSRRTLIKTTVRSSLISSKVSTQEKVLVGGYQKVEKIFLFFDGLIFSTIKKIVIVAFEQLDRIISIIFMPVDWLFKLRKKTKARKKNR